MARKLKFVTTVVGIVAGAAAVITFLLDVRKLSTATTEAVAVAKQQRWDKLRPMLVYKAIRQCGSKGGTLDEIRNRYVPLAAPIIDQLPGGSKDLEDAALDLKQA